MYPADNLLTSKGRKFFVLYVQLFLSGDCFKIKKKIGIRFTIFICKKSLHIPTWL